MAIVAIQAAFVGKGRCREGELFSFTRAEYKIQVESITELLVFILVVSVYALGNALPLA